MRVLNIGYLNQSQKLYNKAKQQIDNFLKAINKQGFNKFILYGAGEVAEIILRTINDSKLDISVDGLIDDDLEK